MSGPQIVVVRVYDQGRVYEIPRAVLEGVEELREALKPIAASTAQRVELTIPMFAAQFESLFYSPHIAVEVTQPPPQAAEAKAAVITAELVEPESPAAPPTPAARMEQLVKDIRSWRRTQAWFSWSPNYRLALKELDSLRGRFIRQAVEKNWMHFGVDLHDFVDAVIHERVKVIHHLFSRFVVAAGEEAANQLVALLETEASLTFRSGRDGRTGGGSA